MNERLRKLRKALNMSQTAFGKRVGLKQSTITGYETGKRIPLDSVILLICKEFNVNEEWLRSGKGEMFSSPQIGSRIKTLRKSLNLTQNDFGDRIGVKANTIGNYELSLRNPSNAVIHSICIEFNVNENWLRFGKGEMFSQNKTFNFRDISCDNSSSKFNNMLLDIMTFLNQLDDEQKGILYPIFEEIAKIIIKSKE